MDYKTIKDISKFNVCVADNAGKLRNVEEIISEMQNLYDNYNLIAMDFVRCNTLKSEKDMLGEIIDYLKRL
jgi:malic enzyme